MAKKAKKRTTLGDVRREAAERIESLEYQLRVANKEREELFQQLARVAGITARLTGDAEMIRQIIRTLPGVSKVPAPMTNIMMVDRVG